LADLKKVPVPLPSLTEQHQIVAELKRLHAEVDTLRRLQTDTTAELGTLLPTILDRAFKGKLLGAI
jgi:type I restriction enzyme, S subunit